MKCYYCEEHRVSFGSVQDGWKAIDSNDILNITYSCIDYTWTKCKNDECSNYICSVCHESYVCECGAVLCGQHLDKCSSCELVVCESQRCAQECTRLHCSKRLCLSCYNDVENVCTDCGDTSCPRHMTKCIEDSENVCTSCSENCQICNDVVCNAHASTCFDSDCERVVCSSCVYSCGECHMDVCKLHVVRCGGPTICKAIVCTTNVECIERSQCNTCMKRFCWNHKHKNRHTCNELR